MCHLRRQGLYLRGSRAVPQGLSQCHGVTSASLHTCSQGGLFGPHAGSPVPGCHISPAEDEQLFRSVEGQAASEEEEEERKEKGRRNGKAKQEDRKRKEGETRMGEGRGIAHNYHLLL